MNLRWLFFRYLPPGLKINTRTRRHIFSATFLGDRPDQVWPIAGPFLFFLPIYVGIVGVGCLQFMIPLIPVFWLSGALLGRWFLAPRAYKALQRLGRDQCLACTYPRDGLPAEETRCPECGTAFGLESCIHCRQSLRGIEQARFCPECGGDQQLAPPPPNLRWLICQYIDARAPLSRKQLADARRRGVKSARGRNHRMIILAVILVPLVILQVVFWMLTDVEALRAISDTIYTLGDGSFRLIIVGVAIFWWMVLAWLMRHFYAPAVRAAVAAQGHDICLACGHWLEGSVTPRHCPACGDALPLESGARRPA